MKRTFLIVLMACLTAGIASAQKYSPFHYNLNKTFKVKGGIGIEQFVRAVGIYDASEPEKTIIDKKNGYFDYYMEGDGGFSYQAAYWNRKDGKKLLIVAYYASWQFTVDADSSEYVSPWFYSSIVNFEENGEPYRMRHETGFQAYLYNASTKQLVPTSDVPFNGWTQESVFRKLMLPRKGKDIRVIEGFDPRTTTFYELSWNGLTFDNCNNE